MIITNRHSTSTTTHNLVTFNIAKYHQITRKNAACFQINTSGLFSYTRLIQVPGCTVTRSADQHRPCFNTRNKRSLGLGESSRGIIPEKRTISFLSVSARIRGIDSFSQMKREYNTILDDTGNPINFVPVSDIYMIRGTQWTCSSKYLFFRPIFAGREIWKKIVYPWKECCWEIDN